MKGNLKRDITSGGEDSRRHPQDSQMTLHIGINEWKIRNNNDNILIHKKYQYD